MAKICTLGKQEDIILGTFLKGFGELCNLGSVDFKFVLGFHESERPILTQRQTYDTIQLTS